MSDDYVKTYTITVVTKDVGRLADAASLTEKEYIRAVVVNHLAPVLLDIKVEREWMS